MRLTKAAYLTLHCVGARPLATSPSSRGSPWRQHPSLLPLTNICIAPCHHPGTSILVKGSGTLCIFLSISHPAPLWVISPPICWLSHPIGLPILQHPQDECCYLGNFTVSEEPAAIILQGQGALSMATHSFRRKSRKRRTAELTQDTGLGRRRWKLESGSFSIHRASLIHQIAEVGKFIAL